MKKSAASKRGVQDSGQQPTQQPDKVGWIRKFCGRGIFRELWRNRFMILRGEHLYISEKEVKDDRKAQEVFHLADYERSEELRKAKSRSKKNHSRFILLRCKRPGNSVPNLLFLAVSPEEKESWINALNVAVTRAKNRSFDEVTIEEDGVLAHPTRDRAKIPYSRRLPTRGHLLAVASTSSHGMLTLDLVAEEDGALQEYDDDCDDSWENDLQMEGSCGQTDLIQSRQRADTDVSKLRVTPKEPKVKTSSLPRGSERSWGKSSHLDAAKVHKKHQVLQAQSRTPQPGKRFIAHARSRCASMDEVLSSRPAMIRSELRSALRRCPTEEAAGSAAGSASAVQPVGQLQSLIAQRMQRAQELLEEMRLQELQKAKVERERGGGSPYLKGVDSPRLHHLRGADSAHSSRSSGSPRSRSSDSPRLRGKDSPRLRGRESPRSKAKRNRTKGADSPRSRGSSSPATRTKDSPQPKESLQGPSRCSGPDPEDVPAAQNSPEPNALGSNTSQVKSGSALLQKSETCGSDPGSPRSDQKTSPSPSGSFESSHSRTADNPCVSPPSPVLLREDDLDVASQRAEAERLLEEAVSSWKEAQEVLQEVKELQSQTLRRQRRRTYEKMMPTPAVTDESDTMASPTSPEEDGEKA
ncbi:pleckstrin homology domain-containing family O member 1-A isoform X1 [Takifugu rubripes]|uniref:pleckstrin homology domain-containing family O member 1-A isoform X1 n=1 Tax=Takifugu rubripes TaxID=31033 RepID=UPI001145F30A|nr:pleckstrin homology domain-containing family O member 1-A-like isoform X1 [Takifugu rubripes]